MVLRAKKMALFDFDITICKTTQKWQKKGHFTTSVPVDPLFSQNYELKCIFTFWVFLGERVAS